MVIKTRVFVVDDSALVRQFMTEVIQGQPDMMLAGVAADPVSALPKMQQQWPDVILLDVKCRAHGRFDILATDYGFFPSNPLGCYLLFVEEAGASLTLEALSAGLLPCLLRLS